MLSLFFLVQLDGVDIDASASMNLDEGEIFGGQAFGALLQNYFLLFVVIIGEKCDTLTVILGHFNGLDGVVPTLVFEVWCVLTNISFSSLEGALRVDSDTNFLSIGNFPISDFNLFSISLSPKMLSHKLWHSLNG